jgi:hypothetical protein
VVTVRDGPIVWPMSARGRHQSESRRRDRRVPRPSVFCGVQGPNGVSRC